MKKLLLLLTSLSIFAWACTEREQVSVESLLREMVDSDSKTYFPTSDYYTLRQASSYDRATVTPDDKSWFANWDRSMFIRIDSTAQGRKEYVMMDQAGPGAVVRFWMTFAGENCGKGILRIYIDNDTQPVVEGAAFDVLSGKVLVDGILATSVSDITDYHMRGHNLYFPIPYSKHCKVTYESENIKDEGAKTGGEAVYYNINYREYAAGTNVTSYSKAEMEKNSELLSQVQRTLTSREVYVPTQEVKITSNNEVHIEPKSESVITLEGEQIIKRLSLRVDTSQLSTLLRTTIVEMIFDGERTVWAPLGDFFGTGYQLRGSNLWFSRVSPDGEMESYWPMPYKKSCDIKFRNLSGESDITIYDLKIYAEPYDWKKNSMHFGAGWQQFTNLATGEMKNNEGDGEPFDINYVELTGRGRYMGDAITMFNTVYAWWGEGDEKIYIDGETFPSHIGTGTEDYYGYAWCRPEKFSNHPFIAQPDGSGNFDPGYTINIRHRGLDDIPFSKSIRVDMEMWHWTRAVINFAPIAYWYAEPAVKSNRTEDHDNALAPLARIRRDLVPNKIVNGMIEGESLDLVSKTGGGYRFQNTLKYGWSDNMQMFWYGAAVGEKITMSFESDKAISGDISALLTKGPDYGTFDIAVNDRVVGANIVLTNPKVVVENVILKGAVINEGYNTITVTVRRQNADKKSAFGIDCLRF